jgi:predicted RNase H-like nuclease (RuvC/YqgF family)
MLSDSALMEAARYCDNDLALVLGERLEELWTVEQQLEALKNEVVELNARCDHWQAEAVMLQASLDRIDAE